MKPTSMNVRGTVVMILLLSTSIRGQSAQQPTHEENISEKVVNPIAFLMRLTLENKYSPSLWNSAGEENEVEGELVIPFEAFSTQNLARIKVFFETSSPDGTHGLSESEVFDLLLFPRHWGTFGIGVTTHLSAQTSNSLGAVSPGARCGRRY